jgi:hypothetical protein
MGREEKKRDQGWWTAAESCARMIDAPPPQTAWVVAGSVQSSTDHKAIFWIFLCAFMLFAMLFAAWVITQDASQSTEDAATAWLEPTLCSLTAHYFTSAPSVDSACPRGAVSEQSFVLSVADSAYCRARESAHAT